MRRKNSPGGLPGTTHRTRRGSPAYLAATCFVFGYLVSLLDIHGTIGAAVWPLDTKQSIKLAPPPCNCSSAVSEALALVTPQVKYIQVPAVSGGQGPVADSSATGDLLLLAPDNFYGARPVEFQFIKRQLMYPRNDVFLRVSSWLDTTSFPEERWNFSPFPTKLSPFVRSAGRDRKGESVRGGPAVDLAELHHERLDGDRRGRQLWDAVRLPGGEGWPPRPGGWLRAADHHVPAVMCQRSHQRPHQRQVLP
jgi:hypothetical protein